MVEGRSPRMRGKPGTSHFIVTASGLSPRMRGKLLDLD